MKRKNESSGNQNGFEHWGGYMAAKKTKLLEQFNEDINRGALKSTLFHGIAILVNGYTKPSSEELKQIMAEHGGLYHIYQSSGLTTHIIASNLPNVKIKQMGSVPVVRPEWIVDSVNAMKLLDYKSYLLYTNQSVTQPQIKFEKRIESKKNTMENVKSASTTAKTATDPEFISDFYNNSRLHLIATLGAEFKQLVNNLRENSNGIFPGLLELKKNNKTDSVKSMTKVVMHIDMDCFFVSVGLRNRPDLKGKPVAVTHARTNRGNSNNVDRQVEFSLYMQRLPGGVEGCVEDLDNNCSMSEIASCSYKAREYGIKNGMFLGVALKMCPDLKTIPYDFDGYKEVSKILYNTIANYTLDIEAVSCDEMYVDVTHILQTAHLSVNQWADLIRAEVIEKTGCPCSTGFGGNRLQARLATKKAKPAGSYYLQPEDIEAYIYEIPLKELPGVGRATLNKLRSLQFLTCGDLQSKGLQYLQNEFGHKNGENLYDQVRGIDKKPLTYDHVRKSVSAEVNYGIRFISHDEALKFLEQLSEEVAMRLKDTGMKAKCVTLKLLIRAEEAPTETAKFLGHGVCDAINRSTTTNYFLFEPSSVFKEIKSIYLRQNITPNDLRGIGIQLSRLEKDNVATNGILKKFLTNAANNNCKSDDQSKEHAKRDLFACDKTLKTGDKKILKNTQNDQINATVNNRNDLNKYFRNVKHSYSGKNKVHSYKYSDIDLSVLNELPEDIKEEILRECKTNTDKTDKTPSNNKKIDCDTKKEPEKSKQKSGFATLTFDELKVALIKWINCKKGPKQTDVKMLGNYCKQLAIDREIEKLHVITKFLFRNINNSGKCEWHTAYFNMLNYLQEGMLLAYGNTLLVPRDFNCIKHSSQQS